MLAGAEFLEACDGVGELDVFAVDARERLSDKEGLREEPLDFSCPRDDQLVLLGEFVGDKTNWRKMLKGPPGSLVLADERERLFAALASKLAGEAIPGEPVRDSEQVSFTYPVNEYPSKVVSHNLDKQPLLEGTLMGVKGQYLIFDSAVINVRKYTGHVVRLEA